MLRRRSASGFTLIELLIVVAIIAILAAIAVPNFLEAQTRAKVSRVKADLRTLLTAVETYHIDSNKYPLHMLVDQVGNIQLDPWLADRNGPAYAEFHFSEKNSLTTPVSYINQLPLDPFFRANVTVNPPPNSGPAATGQRGISMQTHVSEARGTI
jgi:prepilin-type N-terminal cleavage/methylation domain-containing protein